MRDCSASPGCSGDLRRALLLAGSLCAAGAPLRGMAADRLTVMTWSGYELPQFHPDYDRAHPEGANIAVVSNDDEQFAKVRAGYRTDIAHPCIDRVQDWRDAHLIQPIDTSRIRNWDRLFPILRQIPGVVADGKVWMLPWDWANTSITYRTDLVAGHPDSWTLLWDPKYEARTAMIDAVHDAWLVAALVAKVDPFDESPADIARTADVLRRQVALASFYTADMTTLEQSLASGELVAAMTWNSAYVELRKQGVPVAFMRPKEGMLTWVCGLVLMQDSRHVDLAYDFFNAMETEAVGVALIRAYGYGVANSDSFAAVPEAERDALALPRDPQHELHDTILVRPMRDRARIASTYATVKAGG